MQPAPRPRPARIADPPSPAPGLPRLNAKTVPRSLVAVALILTGLAGTGCRTAAPLPAMDLSQPGWHVRQGQATWRARRDAAEISGELLVAGGPDEKRFLQFTKIPLPFVVVQTGRQSWQIEFPAENRRYSGRGRPPSRLAWIQLLRPLEGEAPASPWRFDSLPDNRWRLENPATGEFIEGFLAPVSQASSP